MDNLWTSLGVSITLWLSLFLNGCNFISFPVSQAGAEKPKAENKLMDESKKGQKLPISAQLLINNQKIDLEVAQTPEQQQLGLMYRSFLPENRGMLFPFEQPIVASFWMKNVDISLDLIFISNGVVDSIAYNVPPCKKEPCPIYRSQGFVDQVIELAGGRSQELNIQKGDRLEIHFFNWEQKK